MGRRFLDKSKQIHPKNLLRGLIKPNPLPYPLSLGEGISVICSRLAPHPFPKPLTKQFTGLFCSAESPRGRNTTFPLEILRFAQYDEI